MAVPLFVIPPVIKVLFTTVIGAKIVGFIASWITSPVNHSMRHAFIEHVENVLKGMGTGKNMIDEDALNLIRTHIATLQSGVETGWTDPRHTYALYSILTFLSWTHLKTTGEGVGKLTASHLNAAGEWAHTRTTDAIAKLEKFFFSQQPPTA